MKSTKPKSPHFISWMEDKKANRPKQVWNEETHSWEKAT